MKSSAGISQGLFSCFVLAVLYAARDLHSAISRLLLGKRYTYVYIPVSPARVRKALLPLWKWRPLTAEDIRVWQEP